MRTACTAGAILFLLALSPPALADEPRAGDEEEIRKALEADRAALPPPPPAPVPAAAAPGAQGGTGSQNPDIAVILDVAGAWWSGKEPRPAGGHDPSRVGFNLQALEMAISANVDPYFRFVGALVFSQFGVEVEDAYGQTLALPWGLQVRAGQILTRFGRINPTHPHAWSFADQPLVVGKFLGSEGSRGLGAELSWLLPLPWYVELIGSATDAAGECCARSFLGGDDIEVDSPKDFLYTAALKQFFPFGPAWSLLWGLSGQFGPNATGNGNRTEIYGTDLFLKWRPVGSPEHVSVSLQAEGMMRVRQVPDDRLIDWGAYGQLVWHFLKRWETGARVDWVSGLAADPLDPRWTGDRWRASAQMTFFPSHFSRIRLQGEMDQAAWSGRTWGAVLALELSAGAHGAHEY